jgi:hypothetical protein
MLYFVEYCLEIGKKKSENQVLQFGWRLGAIAQKEVVATDFLRLGAVARIYIYIYIDVLCFLIRTRGF